MSLLSKATHFCLLPLPSSLSPSLPYLSLLLADADGTAEALCVDRFCVELILVAGAWGVNWGVLDEVGDPCGGGVRGAAPGDPRPPPPGGFCPFGCNLQNRNPNSNNPSTPAYSTKVRAVPNLALRLPPIRDPMDCPSPPYVAFNRPCCLLGVEGGGVWDSSGGGCM